MEDQDVKNYVPSPMMAEAMDELVESNETVSGEIRRLQVLVRVYGGERLIEAAANAIIYAAHLHGKAKEQRVVAA